MAAILVAEPDAPSLATKLEALAKGPMNTLQLSTVLLHAKGLAGTDKVLAKAISYRSIHALRIQARNGKIVAMGREKAARVWRLPETLV